MSEIKEYFVHSDKQETISFKTKKDILEHKCFLQAFKIALSRKHKMSLIEYAINEGFALIKCVYCNRFILPDKIEYTVKNNQIIINNIGYTNPKFFYCRRSDCSGKELNPNSIEFVMKSYNLSLDDARKLIHKRNSSPFYKENHKNEEEYKKYQTRDKNWYESRGLSITDSVKLGNYHKSLSYKVKMFGKEIGEKIYNDTNRKKSMFADDVLIQRYGINNHNKILEHKINFIISSSHNKLSKDIFYSVDKLVKYVYNLLNEYVKLKPTKESIIKQVNNIRHKTHIHIACESLSIQYDDFIDKYLFPYAIAQSEINDDVITFFKKTNTGYMFVTQEGYLLRSSFEKDFYLAMVESGLNKEKFIVNGLYPNQNNTNYRYDFYFPEIDTYIEIAGLIGFKNYNEVIKEKKKLFNPLIVYTHEDIIPTINNLNESFKRK